MSSAATVTSIREHTSTHFSDALPAASEALLQARIKDLRLHLKGTVLERYIHQLYDELAAKGIVFRPDCYLSDEWGCPSEVPVIGLPFYLADPNLARIEDALGAGAEDESEFMMLLRHEAGHAFNYAYKLYETSEWQQHFGDFGKPYVETYKPRPFSRKYVVHIAGWYAQKHPDEDFAETFAVWLTPDLDWRAKYRNWGALKKLEYVGRAVAEVGARPPLVTLHTRDLEVDDMEETVLDHYRQRRLAERVELSIGEALDADLCDIFEAPGVGNAAGETLLRSERQPLLASVTQYSGISWGVAMSLIDHLLERVSALGLTVQHDRAREYVTPLTALLTTLAMNYVYTDRFFEVD